MSAHTPGPWLVIPPGEDDLEDWQQTIWWQVRAGPDGPLAAGSFQLCVLGSLNTPSVEADARLIAAAPDMLRVLEGAEFALNTPENNRQFAEDEFVPVTALALREIRAVMAKAKGEQP